MNNKVSACLAQRFPNVDFIVVILSLGHGGQREHHAKREEDK
jgi:hypothetical protein